MINFKTLLASLLVASMSTQAMTAQVASEKKNRATPMYSLVYKVADKLPSPITMPKSSSPLSVL